jgi:Zn-dependent alcohol dehydrogenase
MAMRGELLLEEMITRRLPLADINSGFADLAGGNVARAVVTFHR